MPSAACVAPEWPEWVTDEEGTFWVRLDLEDQAERLLRSEREPGYRLVRLCRNLMAFDPESYRDEPTLSVVPTWPSVVTDGYYEPQDCVVYVRFEDWFDHSSAGPKGDTRCLRRRSS